MTANQIAWWNIQENIRSHMQNELNERNKQSITRSLGDEQNRISNQKIKNDFILGTQGNSINQQQADTAAKRASQDYEIGKATVANTATRNKQDYAIGKATVSNTAIRNKQDYEIGTQSNVNKSREIGNNYVLGRSGLEIQSIRNAQDYAIGKLQQTSNARQADAALLNAGAQIGKLNPAQVVVALAAPTAQKAVDTGVKKVVQTVKEVKQKISAPKPITQTNEAQRNSINSPRSARALQATSKPVIKTTSKPKPKNSSHHK